MVSSSVPGGSPPPPSSDGGIVPPTPTATSTGTSIRGSRERWGEGVQIEEPSSSSSSSISNSNHRRGSGGCPKANPVHTLVQRIGTKVRACLRKVRGLPLPGFTYLFVSMSAVDYIHFTLSSTYNIHPPSLPLAYPIHILFLPQCAGGGKLFGSVLLPRGGNEQWQRHGAVRHQNCQEQEEDWRRRCREDGKPVGMVQRMYATYLFSTSCIHP